jgi:hypothetical protein
MTESSNPMMFFLHQNQEVTDAANFASYFFRDHTIDFEKKQRCGIDKPRRQMMSVALPLFKPDPGAVGCMQKCRLR